MRLQWAWMLGALCAVHTASAQLVTLKEMPSLSKGMAAFPRVVPNAAVSATVAATINVSLQRHDEKVVQAAKECSDEFQESEGHRSSEGWTRKITVAMQGPAFLSMDAEDFQYCGGAHPEMETMPLVYDLTTGKALTWKSVLPADATVRSDYALDGTPMDVVRWNPLRAMVLQASHAECRDALAGSGTIQFSLSLDGRVGALVVRVFGLAHSIGACGGPFRISAAKAKQLGVSARVTDALTASATMYKKH